MTTLDERWAGGLIRLPRRLAGGGPGYLPLVAALAAATFLQWIGSSAVLPLLPVYLRSRGNSDAMVGAVMAAFFAAGVVAQYGSGRLGDRIGHRAVLLTGLVGYAVASVGFLADLGGTWYVLLRAGQGASAGAAQVAILALITRAVPLDVRGRAVSAVYGAELAGIAIGPLAGSALGLPRMGLLFVVASGAALLAGVPVLGSRLVRVASRGAVLEVAPLIAAPGTVAGAASRREGSPAPGRSGRPGRFARLGRPGLPARGSADRVLAGVLLAAVTGGLLAGVYEACWTLLLDRRGATPWQIGMSWTLFAVPFVLAAPLAGWAADRADRRWIVVAAMVTSIGFALLYPWVGDMNWLIGLGAVESLGVAFAYPSAQSLLGQVAAPDAVGWAQGLFASMQTAAIAVAAGASGALFALGPWVPFTAVSVLALGLTAALPVVWRGVPGHVPRR